MAERLNVTTDPEWGWIEDHPSYRDVVETFGEVLIEEVYGDYSGDSLFLIRESSEYERYGVLTFGWGSCSGCDALESCSSQEEVNNLQDDLERGIKWFYSISDVKEYLTNGGLKGSYLNADLVLNFGAQVVKIEDY